MPDKEGSDEKSTKSVVSKKQKQMMGEEGYDIARDMGRVRPSKDKKDATTMPVSDEVKKTQKVNKGPSALDIVKKKYKGQIMKMEELDLTQVAEAFGGYIVEAPVDDREEKKNRAAKKLAKAAGINIRTQGPEQAAATQAFKDMRMSKEKKFSDITPDVKSGMRATAAGEGKAEPKKPRAPRKGVDYFFDAEKAKADRDKLISKRKEYEIDPKTNRPSAAGIEKYARKTKQSNLPLSQDDLKTAEVRMAGTGEKGTDVGKYGGRLGRRRGKNMPSLDQVKADIDKQNPTYTGQSGGQLPFPTRQSSYKSPVDTFIDRINRAKKEDPEGLKKGLQDMPDDPRMAQLSPMSKMIRKPESVVGKTGGLVAKTLSPALAGTEAMQRYQSGDKKGAAISAVQALGGPIGFGAGVINALRKTGVKTDAKSTGDGSGGKPPEPPTTGSVSPEPPSEDPKPKSTLGGVQTAASVADLSGLQLSKDARETIGKTLNRIFNPKNFQARKRTKTGRRSAGS